MKTISKNKMKLIVNVCVILLLCICVWNLTSILVGRSYKSRHVIVDKELEKAQDKITETEITVTTEVLTTEDLSNVYLEHLEPCYLPGDVQMQEIEE